MPLAAPSITTIGTRVGRCATSASWASDAACARKITAVSARWPKRAAIGAKRSRAGSCIAPIQPIITAATVGE